MKVSFSKYDAIAKENIGSHKCVYISGSREVKLAKADSEDTLPCVGMTEHAADIDTYVQIYTNDMLDGFSGLIPGASYYLSQTTAGEITIEKPSSGIIVRIGTALTSTGLDIHILRLASSNTSSATPKGYLSGLNTHVTDISIAKIDPGYCRNDTNDGDIEVTEQITIDITSTGANGLDTGSEQTSTWYYIWLIYNPTTETVAGLFSLSSTNPTLPEGYTKKRRVGAAKNQGDGNLRKYQSYLNGNTKRIRYDKRYEVLNTSGQTSWMDVDCSILIPSVSEFAWMEMYVQRNGYAAHYWRKNGTDITETDAQGVFGDAVGSCQADIPLDSNQIYEYTVNHAATSAVASILGYIEEL